MCDCPDGPNAVAMREAAARHSKPKIGNAGSARGLMANKWNFSPENMVTVRLTLETYGQTRPIMGKATFHSYGPKKTNDVFDVHKADFAVMGHVLAQVESVYISETPAPLVAETPASVEDKAYEDAAKALADFSSSLGVPVEQAEADEGSNRAQISRSRQTTPRIGFPKKDEQKGE